MKWPILLLLGWLVWRILRPGRTAPRSTAQPRSGETMRACAHCRLNIPHSEAVWDEDVPYCCEAHRRLGPMESPE